MKTTKKKPTGAKTSQNGKSAAKAIRTIANSQRNRQHDGGTLRIPNPLKNAINKLMKSKKPLLEPAPKVKENRLWQWFNDGVRAALENWHGGNQLHRLHMLRVETTTMAGYSDVEACYNGTGFIAELKTLARPEMKDKRRAPTLSLPHFTTAQALFLEARWNAGERSWLFVQVGDTRYLIPGKKANAFLKPFKEAALAAAAIDTMFGDTPMDFLLAMVGK